MPVSGSYSEIPAPSAASKRVVTTASIKPSVYQPGKQPSKFSFRKCRKHTFFTHIYQKVFIHVGLNVASFASNYLKIEDYVVFVFCFRVKMWNKQGK